MTNDEPLSDDELDTTAGGSDAVPGGDADGTDGDGTDGTDGDDAGDATAPTATDGGRHRR